MQNNILILLLLIMTLIVFPSKTDAKNNSFVTIVNPIRGEEFWDQTNQKPEDAVRSQMDILNKHQALGTWLIRFDAFKNSNIINTLKNNPKHEIGLFLEVLPSLTSKAGVAYHKSNSWHDPESVFLIGYSVDDRHKIIDSLFTDFKNIFGFYPRSVGAWWIDAASLNYMNQKYGVVAALITADQYSTDNYRIWGQYWTSPYYPFSGNTLLPARSVSDKIPVVVTQWAPRDPFNGYGKAVEESTYSVQPNDYIDFWNLDINYFSKLVYIYTKTDNQVAQLTIGLENSYNWNKYKDEYEKQIKDVISRRNKSEIMVSTMSEFAQKYQNLFSQVSPTMTFFANNPLDSKYKVFWFMNPHYRAALFFDKKGIRLRDLREYSSSEEPCLKKSCDRLNFTNSFISSIDDVAMGKSLYLDDYNNFEPTITKQDDKIIITYKNSQGDLRTIEFLPRDIKIDEQIYTISGLIIKTNKEYVEREPKHDAGTRLNFWEIIKNWFFNIVNKLKFK